LENQQGETSLQYNTQKAHPLTNRTQRENELKMMLANHEGRNQLTQLLRQAMNIPSGQLPVGTPIVETILNHEFSGVAEVPVPLTTPLPMA
jgi:hypothetical protein